MIGEGGGRAGRIACPSYGFFFFFNVCASQIESFSFLSESEHSALLLLGEPDLNSQ